MGPIIYLHRRTTHMKEDKISDRDSFINIANRIKRRRPMRNIVETFNHLHTGPHSLALLQQFKAKREELDSLSRKYNKNNFRKD